MAILYSGRGKPPDGKLKAHRTKGSVPGLWFTLGKSTPLKVTVRYDAVAEVKTSATIEGGPCTFHGSKVYLLKRLINEAINILVTEQMVKERSGDTAPYIPLNSRRHVPIPVTVIETPIYETLPEHIRTGGLPE